MTSKEAFYILIEAWHGSKDNGNYPSFDDINEALDTLEQALERLEVLEKENQKLLVNKNVAQALAIKLNQENEKLKKAIALLNLLFDFEIDIETETIYCCLGDVSVNGTNLIEDFELLKEVINNEI